MKRFSPPVIVLFPILFCILFAILFAALFAGFLPNLVQASDELVAAQSVRTTVDFNDGWTFALVEQGSERSKAITNLESPDQIKAGDALIPEKLGESKSVRLPHDWAISGPFDTTPNVWGGQGKLPWRGVGWYTKTFDVETVSDKTFVLDFGGCMAFPEVYVNGQYAGGWDYGYLGFQVNITEFLVSGKNTVQVRCDTRRHGSRWYPGAGIYRPVRLITTASRARLNPGDVTITTPNVSAESAEVVVHVQFDKTGLVYPFSCSATVELKDAMGNSAGSKTAVLKDGQGAALRFTVDKPIRWDVLNPHLYTATVRIVSDGGCVTQEDGSQGLFGKQDLDEITVPFGIRQIEWTADDGFHLNGRRVQLYGVDLHHDQGILGAAAHPTAIERQLKILRDMGVNAIRTSHNPASPEFMDACDRLGFIVWDELFDKWDATSDLLDQQYFDAYMERQVRQLVNRDKNRPSVCVWSIGNEIWDIEQNVKGGSNPNLDAPRRVKLVADAFRKFDPSRLVGMGCFVEGSCGPESHVRDSLDVTGWNYGAKYKEARVRYPKMPLLYTESASAVSTRGYYELVDAKHTYPGWFHPLRKDDYNKETLQVDGYDLISANGPRDIPDIDFDRMERDRYVAGEFVWTGFDYIGEPTPFDKQAKSSYFGIVDLVGLPKDRFYLYRSYWNPDQATIHILPHWNWAGSAGFQPAEDAAKMAALPAAVPAEKKIVPVYVYTNGDSAELFLNGKSLGRRTKVKELADEPIENLAAQSGVTLIASSEEGADAEGKAKGKTNFAPRALDGRSDTRWCAADASENQWLQIQFPKQETVRALSIEFEKSIENYQFRIQSSPDGASWQTLYAKSDFSGSGPIFNLNLEKGLRAAWFRIVFDRQQNNSWASIREFVVSETVPDSLEKPAYYAVIDKYRLRWENVVYEPGTLEAVAYKTTDGPDGPDGRKEIEIGRQVVKTAGEPAALRLTADLNPFTGKVGFQSNDDLAYFLVESVDKSGIVCPLDMRTITAKVTGSAELVGIANGNPLGMDSFTDASHPLFYGKAVIVLRSLPGAEPVELTVSSDGVESDKANLDAPPEK